MSTWPPRRGLLDALIGGLAATGLVLVLLGGRPAPEPTTTGLPPAPTPSPSEARPQPSPTPTPAAPAPMPVYLEIPAIDVRTSLMTLGLNPDGTVAVPPLRADSPAGWYRYLPVPGETGPSVILGHVDTASGGPAVFHRLAELRPTDTIIVYRADGSRVVFRVRERSVYDKTTFPTEAVYGWVDEPVLRLVTCGGSFDRLRRQYRSNVVVYATLQSN